MRLKDFDDIMASIKATPHCDAALALMIAYNAPTIDAAPVVYGRWDFVTDYTSRCTNCCEIQWIDHDKEPRYCPNCGARMDGGEEHEAD